MAFARRIAAFDEQTLAPTSPLRRLSLMHCGLSDEAAIVLNWALALPRCPLQNLNLSHNSISAAGIAVLADSMTRNTCLERLDIGVNPGSRGAAAERLHEAMSKESVKRRRHREFRKVALLILLQAQRSQDAMVVDVSDGGAAGSSSGQAADAGELEPLARLPHSVLLEILRMAAPEGFVVD